MKTLRFILTVVTSMLAMSLVAEAKDKNDKKKDRYYEEQKKAWKVTRDDLRELREQYGRLSDSTRRGDCSYRVRQETEAIGIEVQRLSAQFEHGNDDYRGLSERAARLERAIENVRRQMEHEQSYRRGRDDYRRGDGDRFR